MDFALSAPVASTGAITLPGQMSRMPRVPANLTAAQQQQMQSVAREFEAVFIGQMTESMFSGLKSEAPFGGGHAESMWRSQLAQEMGNTIAEGGGIGIADSVYRSMLAQQEMATRPNAIAPAPIHTDE
jgi:Rod binding domain-containing protein